MLQRHLILGAVLCFSASSALAQQQLTNRDIWASPQFSAESVGGLASMNDGAHYSVLDDVDGRADDRAIRIQDRQQGGHHRGWE